MKGDLSKTIPLIFRLTKGTIPPAIRTHLEEFPYDRVIIIMNETYFMAQPILTTAWGDDTKKYLCWKVNGEYIPPNAVTAYAILPFAIDVVGGL